MGGHKGWPPRYLPVPLAETCCHPPKAPTRRRQAQVPRRLTVRYIPISLLSNSGASHAAGAPPYLAKSTTLSPFEGAAHFTPTPSSVTRPWKGGRQDDPARVGCVCACACCVRACPAAGDLSVQPPSLPLPLVDRLGLLPTGFVSRTVRKQAARNTPAFGQSDGSRVVLAHVVPGPCACRRTVTPAPVHCVPFSQHTRDYGSGTNTARPRAAWRSDSAATPATIWLGVHPCPGPVSVFPSVPKWPGPLFCCSLRPIIPSIPRRSLLRFWCALPGRAAAPAFVFSPACRRLSLSLAFRSLPFSPIRHPQRRRPPATLVSRRRRSSRVTPFELESERFTGSLSTRAWKVLRRSRNPRKAPMPSRHCMRLLTRTRTSPVTS